MIGLPEKHLGDGLYASFDGYQFKLRAPRLEGDHEVFLEPAVLQSFDDYVNRTYEHFGVARPERKAR